MKKKVEELMENIDVFAVYGDFGNVGSGELIGVFENWERAEQAAIGRGSLDCGGDGHVAEKKAIKDGDDIYLLELGSSINLNQVIKRDPRREYAEVTLTVTKIHSVIKFMQVFRKLTGCSLVETKSFVDAYNTNGPLQIPKNPKNGYGRYSMEEATLWVEEFDQIAKIEAT